MPLPQFKSVRIHCTEWDSAMSGPCGQPTTGATLSPASSLCFWKPWCWPTSPYKLGHQEHPQPQMWVTEDSWAPPRSEISPNITQWSPWLGEPQLNV